MDLRHQGTSRVDGAQAPLLSQPADLGGNTVSAVQQGGAFRHLREVLDEDRPLPAKLFYHVFVVDDLVIDIERRPQLLQGPLQAFNGHDDPGAKAARVGQQDAHSSPLMLG